MNRRDALKSIGNGFGMMALAEMLGSTALSAGTAKPVGTHFAPKAKRVIFLFLNGGPSQVDTFDPKPALEKFHGTAEPGWEDGILAPGRIHQAGTLMKSPFPFKKYGQSGIEVSSLFPKLGECIDDVCVVRSMYSDIPNHPQGLFMMNCGTIGAGRPALGSWLLYGLGTVNQNLPGFVVLSPGLPIMAPQIWNSAFLPASYQGTWVNTEKADPKQLIPYIKNDRIDLGRQRQQVELLSSLNQMHLKQQGPAPELEATIQGMETAFHMQTEAVDAFDITKESEATRQAYGSGDFARGCLMSRRLIERGVRMVQVYFGAVQPWDSHTDIMDHKDLALKADQPIAALLADLKARGLLDDTLVIIGGEFGRTPAVEAKGAAVQNGRDHNTTGFTMLLAGGGVKGGSIYGATDELGRRAVEKPVHVHDLHATILHLFGFDHTKLTYRFSGRDFRLTDVSGNVIPGLIA